MKNKSCVFGKTETLVLSSKALGCLVKAFVEKKKSIRFKAMGDSMFPFIKNGDSLSITPYMNDTYEVGDIVAFLNRSTRKIIIHRIIVLSEPFFIAKGDCCFFNDGYQLQKDILGYVSEINSVLLESNFLTNKKIKKVIAFFSRYKFFAFGCKVLKRLYLIFDRY